MAICKSSIKVDHGQSWVDDVNIAYFRPCCEGMLRVLLQIGANHGAQQFLRALLPTTRQRNARRLRSQDARIIDRKIKRDLFRRPRDRWRHCRFFSDTILAVHVSSAHAPQIERHHDNSGEKNSNANLEVTRNHRCPSSLGRTFSTPEATATLIAPW